MKLYRLYRIRFAWKNNFRSMQPVITSAPNQRQAVARARACVQSQYQEKFTAEGAELICTTPDDVLDWS